MSDANAIKSHKDLNVWQSAMLLAERLYRDTAVFPREEIYGMTSQIRRAGVSIAANIAEGFGRSQTSQFIQFLRISQGSAQELDTHLILAGRLGLLTPQVTGDLQEECQRVSKMLRGLIRSLETKASENPRR